MSSHSILMNILHSSLIQYQLGNTGGTAAAAHFYQINGTPNKIDWDENQRKPHISKIRSKSKATSAESHLRIDLPIGGVERDTKEQICL